VAKKKNKTKLDIIEAATRMFLEKGYTDTSLRAICDELDISTGNLTFYFPSKEHLLALLAEMLCEHQWRMMEHAVDEGRTSLLALCLEMTAIAAICEESPIAKDFYLAIYTHPMTLEIIRRNDVEKAKRVFGEYCADWKDTNFREAETLMSGIEFATMLTTESSAPLDVRIAGAIGAVMMIYNVPADIRRIKIDKVLAMDYRAVGRNMLAEFIKYTQEANNAAQIPERL